MRYESSSLPTTPTSKAMLGGRRRIVAPTNMVGRIRIAPGLLSTLSFNSHENENENDLKQLRYRQT
jgi:hypothetical protein